MRVLVAAVLAHASFACTKIFSPKATSLSVDDLVQEGDPLRLAFLDDGSFDLLKTTQKNLEQSKALVPIINANPQGVSGSLFRSLNWSTKLGTLIEKGSDAATRYDTIQINTDISKVKVFGDKIAVAIPFGFSKGTEINASRVFANARLAQEAPALGLSDLPLNSEAVLKLKPGSYFGIPAKVTFFANISSQFLQGSALFSKELEKAAQGSLTGSYSGIVNAHLLGQGDFQFHIFRLAGNKARVRITNLDTLSGDASIKLGNSAKAHYMLFGATQLSKLKQILHLKALDKPQKLTQWMQILKTQKDLLLPNAVLELGKNQVVAPSQNTGSAIGIAGKALDLAVTELDRFNGTIADINSKVVDRFNKISGELDTKYLASLRNSLDSTVLFEGGIQLGAEFSNSVSLVADYEFDLDFETARVAYERLVSGRVIAKTQNKLFASLIQKDESLLDLTYADEIALLPPDAEGKKAVIRKGTLQQKRSSKAVGLTFLFPKFERSLKERWVQNQLMVSSETHPTFNWFIKKWEFESKLKIGKDATGNTRSSGIIKNELDDLANTAYFYSWKEEHPASSQSAYSDSIKQMINILGTGAFVFGVPDLYQGDLPGDLSFSGQVTLNPGALELFFDDTKVSLSDLWKAFGQFAAWINFDNQTPLLMVGDAENLLQTQESKEICQRFIGGLGQGYCLYFQNSFLPRWKDAAKSKNYKRQIRFLEEFYREGFLANKFGGDFLMRFIIETLYVKLESRANSYINLSIHGTNATDASDPANPKLQIGNADYLELMSTMEEPIL